MYCHGVKCVFRLIGCPINNLRIWKGKLRNILRHVETEHGATVWDEGPCHIVSCHIQRLLGKVSLQRVRRHALGSCLFGTVRFCQNKVNY